MDTTRTEFMIKLPPLLEAVKDARDLIAEAWAAWRLGDDCAARLVVSELVTNSVRASMKKQVIEDVEVCIRQVDGSEVISAKAIRTRMLSMSRTRL